MKAAETIGPERFRPRLEALHADLAGSAFANVSPAGAEFDDAHLAGAAIRDANLPGLRISEANLRGCSKVDSAAGGVTIKGVGAADLMAAYLGTRPKGD